VFQDEGACFPDAHRGNDRSLPELPLVVAVESHAIAVVPVVVEQDAVEDRPCDRFYPTLEIEERTRLGRSLQMKAGVGVVLSEIAVPRGQPRQRESLAL
jgi:hypothetical protein